MIPEGSPHVPGRNAAASTCAESKAERPGQAPAAAGKPAGAALVDATRPEVLPTNWINRAGTQFMQRAFRIALPFDQRSHLVAFVAALFLVLFLPFLDSYVFRLSPADVYRSVPPRYVNYRFIGDEIAKGGNVDVLLIGASDTWTTFDTKALTEALSDALGRPAKVLNFGTNWFGAETYQARVRDALQNLRAKVVLIPDSDAGFTYPHELTKYWWRHPTAHAPDSLNAREQVTLYAASMLGSPHRIWASLRGASNLRLTPSWQSSANAMERSQGFNGERNAFLSHFNPVRTRPAFVDIDRKTPSISPDALFYKNQEDASFVHLHYDYDAYQTAFLKDIDAVVKAQGGIFAMASIPLHFREKPLERAVVRPLWNKQPRSWPSFGVSMTQLFAGLSFDEMKQFYSNESHLNASGARLYSRTIAPALAKLIVDAEKK